MFVNQPRHRPSHSANPFIIRSDFQRARKLIQSLRQIPARLVRSSKRNSQHAASCQHIPFVVVCSNIIGSEAQGAVIGINGIGIAVQHIISAAQLVKSLSARQTSVIEAVCPVVSPIAMWG